MARWNWWSGRQDVARIPKRSKFAAVAHFDLARVRQLLARCPGLRDVHAPWDERAVEGRPTRARSRSYASCPAKARRFQRARSRCRGRRRAQSDLAGVRQLLARCPDLHDVHAPWDEPGKGAPLSTCTLAMLGQAEGAKNAVSELPEREPHGSPLTCDPGFGKGDLGTMEILLRAGCDPNAGVRGRGALHVAAQKGQDEMVKPAVRGGRERPPALLRAAGARS